VIDSLSLKWKPDVSWMSVFGGPQVAPWSVDFETRIAEVSWSVVTEREIW